MPTFEQGKSCLQVSSSLGDKALILNSFTGREGLSSPFQFTLNLYSTSDAVDPSKLLGKDITWCYSPKGDGVGQWFDGRVFSVAQGAGGEYGLRSVSIEVVSWFSLLKETKHRNVFVEKSVKDITQDILSKYPDAVFELNLTEPYKPFSCMVQYEQSDFDFLTWLWESNGIFYFFKFEKSIHTMVIADSSVAFKETTTKGIEFLPGSSKFGTLTSWEHAYRWVNGKATLNDYNFEKPSASLISKATSTADIPGIASYEKYIFPGGYQVAADGKKPSELVVGSTDTLHETVSGSGTLMGFNSGLKFKIEKHSVKSESGKSYIIKQVDHNGNSSASPAYQNSFQCFPEKVKFRPLVSSPRPLIPGVHNAVVAGPSGKEVFTDKYGRIKIQFIWDINSKGSYWVRVSQFLAGKSFGFFSLPRIGEEVLIAFEEGDPCRPIAVGGVYNGEQLTPFKLPEEALFMGLKSKSSPNGTAEDFNELRFEDTKGKEMVFIQANKDMNTVVKNDSTVEIKKNSVTTVSEGDVTFDIQKGKRVSKVYGDDVLSIVDGGLLIDVKNGKRAISINSSDSLTINSDRTTTINGNDTLSLQSGNLAINLQTGNVAINLDAGTYSATSPQSISLTVGTSSVKITPTSVSIESGAINLTVGSTSIKLATTGISIMGGTITIEGTSQVTIAGTSQVAVQGGMINLTGDTEANIKAAQVNVAGSAMVEVQGAVIMIG